MRSKACAEASSGPLGHLSPKSRGKLCEHNFFAQFCVQLLGPWRNFSLFFPSPQECPAHECPAHKFYTLFSARRNCLKSADVQLRSRLPGTRARIIPEFPRKNRLREGTSNLFGKRLGETQKCLLLQGRGYNNLKSKNNPENGHSTLI